MHVLPVFLVLQKLWTRYDSVDRLHLGCKRTFGSLIMDLVVNLDGDYILSYVFYGSHSCGWKCFMEMCLGSDVYMLWHCVYVYDLGSGVIEIIFLLLLQWGPNHWWFERASPPHSTRWYCRQHRPIEWRPTVLVTTSMLGHNTNFRWCLDHRYQMVHRTGVVVPIITARSPITPAVVTRPSAAGSCFGTVVSNRQHRRIIHWSGGDDQYLR